MSLFPTLTAITNEQYGWLRDALPRLKTKLDMMVSWTNGIINVLNDPQNYFDYFPKVEQIAASAFGDDLTNSISHTHATEFIVTGTGFDGDGRASLLLYDDAEAVTLLALRSGNCDLSIEIIEPEADDTALDVSYLNDVITVLLGKTGGAVTTTYTDLKAELETDVDTNGLVFMDILGASGALLVSELEETKLEGGVGEPLDVVIGGFSAIFSATRYEDAGILPSDTALIFETDFNNYAADMTYAMYISVSSRESFPFQLASVSTA